MLQPSGLFLQRDVHWNQALSLSAVGKAREPPRPGKTRARLESNVPLMCKETKRKKRFRGCSQLLILGSASVPALQGLQHSGTDGGGPATLGHPGWNVGFCHICTKWHFDSCWFFFYALQRSCQILIWKLFSMGNCFVMSQSLWSLSGPGTE